MKVLVTGGAGFIGSHVVDKLVDAGHEPRIFDLRPSPFHPPEEVETSLGNLLDPADVTAAIEGCDAVIHLAAAADVGIVAEEPVASEELNSRGTLVVLEAARASGARMIYGSTVWVYGESGSGVVDEDSALGMPRHLYTASKLAGEMYCTSYEELYDVPCTILRFGIPYGPRARPAAVIPIFVNKALAGDPLTIAGDGKQTRRFIYVEDLAEGIVKALDPKAVGRIYNLSSDETVTIRELADTVGELVGDTEVVHTPGRNGDFGGAVISSARADAELGWRASTPLREGVRRYIGSLDTAPQPVPVPAPALADSHARRRRLRPALRMPGEAWLNAVTCALGTLIPYELAGRLDEFDHAQVHSVGLTTLAAILISLVAVQFRTSRNPIGWLAPAAWIVAGYFALVALPWPQHALTVALPEIQTLILSGIGTTLAVAALVSASRLREATATDQA